MNQNRTAVDRGNVTPKRADLASMVETLGSEWTGGVLEESITPLMARL
jgi:hypothetical protein